MRTEEKEEKTRKVGRGRRNKRRWGIKEMRRRRHIN